MKRWTKSEEKRLCSMRWLEGYTFVDIGEILGRSADACRMKYYRCKHDYIFGG